MADFLIRNPLDVTQVFTVSVTLKQLKVTTDDPSLEGQPVWVLEAATLAKDCDGNTLAPVRAHVSNYSTINAEINNLVNELSKNMCWESVTDTYPPKVTSHYPTSNQQNVPLNVTININLKDYLDEEFASSGIDKSSIKFYVKGFDLTSKIYDLIEGNPWNYSFSFKPGTKEPPYAN
jgi:hypothetical protein